jgi:hypothetical protein
MLGDHPTYRLGGATVFGDSGYVVEDGLDPADAVAIASRFMRLPAAKLHHAGVLKQADQWTIGERRQMPLHKIVVDDAARTQLYVGEQAKEVILLTTRGTRALAWVSAIPHWLYFAPLRLHDRIWRRIMTWGSALGVVLALLGLGLAIVQFSPSRPFRFSRILSYNPYAGLMRWHYIAGVIFGVFTLTWVFSGWLSLEPVDWFSRGGLGAGMTEALGGGPLDPRLFPPLPAAAWDQALGGRQAKEVELTRIQGAPYYVVRGVEKKPLLLEANPLRIRREPFATESLIALVRQVNPDVAIVETALLTDYDPYYYSRDREAPLPVLRIKFGDPDRSWVYVDPAMGQMVGRFTRLERVHRWLYHGFHSLDFGFWYYQRPLWDVGVITLILGGTASTAIGLWLGLKRLLRGARPRRRK